MVRKIVKRSRTKVMTKKRKTAVEKEIDALYKEKQRLRKEKSRQLREARLNRKKAAIKADIAKLKINTSKAGQVERKIKSLKYDPRTKELVGKTKKGVSKIGSYLRWFADVDDDKKKK